MSQQSQQPTFALQAYPQQLIADLATQVTTFITIEGGGGGGVDSSADVAALQTRMTAVEGGLTTLDTRLDGLETVPTLPARVTTAEAGLTNLDTRLDALETVPTLPMRLTTAETGLTDLDARIDTLEAAIPTKIQSGITKAEVNATSKQIDMYVGTPSPALAQCKLASGNIVFAAPNNPIALLSNTGVVNNNYFQVGNDTFIITAGDVYMSTQLGGKLTVAPRTEMILHMDNTTDTTFSRIVHPTATTTAGLNIQNPTQLTLTTGSSPTQQTLTLNNQGITTSEFALTGTNQFGMYINTDSELRLKGGSGTTNTRINLRNSELSFQADRMIGGNCPFTGITNNLPTALFDHEVVTWGLLKLLIDTLIPIGSCQLSTNEQKPPDFGFIKWEVAGWYDRYIKIVDPRYSVEEPSTLGAAQMGFHSHEAGSLGIAGYTITSDNNSAFTATTLHTALSAAAGLNRNAVGINTANVETKGTSLTFTSHTHDINIPGKQCVGQTDPAGEGVNEVDRVNLCMYIRLY